MFDRDRRLKMEEFENRAFRIPGWKKPGVAFFGVSQAAQ
jgi:hypothetical protein